jgi:hypothetical protein
MKYLAPHVTMESMSVMDWAREALYKGHGIKKHTRTTNRLLEEWLDSEQKDGPPLKDASNHKLRKMHVICVDYAYP